MLYDKDCDNITHNSLIEYVARHICYMMNTVITLFILTVTPSDLISKTDSVDSYYKCYSIERPE